MHLPVGYPQTLIDEFNTLDLSTYPKEDIIRIIKGIKTPAIATTIPAGSTMVKARPNSDGRSFTKVGELSYKPQEYNKTFQRSSTPDKTVFYAVINPPNPSEKDIQHEQLIAAHETLPFLRDTSVLKGKQIITFGRWRLKKDIEVIPIFFPDESKNSFSYTSELSRAFSDGLNQLNVPPEYLSAFLNVFDFIAGQFAKMEIRGDYDYLFTAYFSEILMHSLGFSGIAFPSVRIERRGINLALRPEIIDDKDLVLEKVLEGEVIKEGSQVVLRNLKFCEVESGATEFHMEEILDPDLLISNEELEGLLNRGNDL